MSVKKNLFELEKIINERFRTKYNFETNDYNIIKIENIIYNDKTHLVSKFKDLMILDDIFEFLSKFYSLLESSIYLPKCLSYYHQKNFIFPNLAGLPESKYLYKNINDKQKILEENFEVDYDNKNNKNITDNEEKDQNIFDNNIYNSIFRGSSFSAFDIKEQNERLDSINDINNLIKEIEKNNYEDVNNINLEISNFNQNKILENKGEDVFQNKINKTNFCYNKFKNIYTKNLMFNKNNKSKHINQKVNNCSSIYIKSIIKKKIFNKKINLYNKTDNDFSTLNTNNNSSLVLLNSLKNSRDLTKNNSRSKKIYLYPFKTPNKPIWNGKRKDSNNKKILLKSIKIKEINNKIDSDKKNCLNLEVFSYADKPNNTIDNIVQNQYLAKTPFYKGNNYSEFNLNINIEKNNDIYIFNFNHFFVCFKV